MKLSPGLAASAGAFFSRTFSDELFFGAVILCFPAFLFQKNTVVLAAETAFFCLTALFRRGKVNLLSPLLLIVFITAFNVLTPFGRVLFTVGAFPVTRGALAAGLRRSLVLTGMVFMSQTAVSKSIALPGKAGEFLSAMFAALDAITAGKIAFKKKFSVNTFIDAIDSRLLAAEEQLGHEENRTVPRAGDTPDAEKPAKRRTTARGAALLAAMTAAAYAALALGKH